MRKWYVVYESALDDEVKEGYAHNGVDAEVGACKRIAEWLGDESQAVRDSETHEHEILVGNTAREQTRRALEQLGFNQYGIFCHDKSIVVCGHCAAATLKACEELMKCDMSELTEGFYRIFTNDKWIVDIPMPQYGRYVGMTDCIFDSVRLVWEQISPAELEEYCGLVTSEGYSLIYSNAIEKNIFRRYERDGRFLHVTYREAGGSVAVISGECSKSPAISDIICEDALRGKVRLTQMTLEYFCGSFGMCYILTLADGSFVIIDGGQVRVKNGYPKTYDYLRLYTLLKELNTREDGEIIIRAWFMTHDHADHFNVFYWFCKEYGAQVIVERYYTCPCSEAVAYNSKNPDFASTNGRLERARQWAGGFDIIRLFPGDRLNVGGISFDVLYTVDELYPERLRYFNDSSFVCAMTFEGQRTMWLGDICTAPSRFLRKHYTEETLKSDIVQLAHHGLNGAEQELYDMIDGRVLLWSLRNRLVNNLFDGEPIEEHKKVARHLRDEMRVEQIFTHTKDNVTLDLPYDPKEGTPTLM